MNWKPIPGYDGRYEMNENAEIRTHYRDGRVRRMKHSFDRTNRGNVRVVDLMDSRGKYKRWSVMALVLLVNGVTIPPGMLPYHINGLQDDNRLENIGFGTPSQLGKMASKCRKPVALLSAAGEIVQIYPSVAEAARKNGYNPATVGAYCAGRIKPPAGGAGFRFCSELSDEA